MFRDNFLRICKEKGLKPTNVVNALHLSSGNLTNWKKGRTPKTDVLIKIANYLDVTVEELLSEENPALSDREKLKKRVDTMTDTQIQAVLAILGEK